MQILAPALAIGASLGVVALFTTIASGGGGSSDRTAFVGERQSDDGRAEGRFDAHWESLSGRDWLMGPEDVDIVQALEWAREHADVVIVDTVEGNRYSAGVQPAEGVSDVWPEGGLSFEPRSIASRWVAWVTVRRSPRSEAAAHRVSDVLGRSPLVESVEVVPEADGVRVRGVVRAETAPEALEVVDELLRPDPLEAWDTPATDLEILGPA